MAYPRVTSYLHVTFVVLETITTIGRFATMVLIPQVIVTMMMTAIVMVTVTTAMMRTMIT